MKTPLLLCATALLFAGCEATIVERRHPSHRTVVVEENGPYRRVYARDSRGRSYYRRAYYNGDVQTRVETRRYYDSRPGPIDRTYGF